MPQNLENLAMLHYFTATGFRCFDEMLFLDFSAVDRQDFSEALVRNRLVKTGIVLANSGAGKTALGMAIFDLTRHLTANHVIGSHDPDMSFGSESGMMEFNYQFRFDEQDLTYAYARSASGDLVYERIIINGGLYAEVDRRFGGGATILADGAEHLKRDFSSSTISIASYIHKNSLLEKNPANECFKKFISFAENMLYFSATHVNSYIGFTKGRIDLGAAILKNGWLDELVSFLGECGLSYRLTAEKSVGQAFIGQRIGNRTMNLLRNTSLGVRKLITFFFWMKIAEAKGKEASFIFIDDMDGLHHLASGPTFQRALESTAQVLITTTSTSMLTQRDVRPDCCFSLSNGSISSFLNRTEKHLRPAHNLERLYRAGAFD